MKIKFELTKWHVIIGCFVWCNLWWLYHFVYTKPSILLYYIPFWTAMYLVLYTVHKIEKGLKSNPDSGII